MSIFERFSDFFINNSKDIANAMIENIGAIAVVSMVGWILLKVKRYFSNKKSTQEKNSWIKWYFESALIYSENLPAFFREHWNKGTTIPNFPISNPLEMSPRYLEIREFSIQLDRLQSFYLNFSQKQGRVGATVEDCLTQLAQIQNELKEKGKICYRLLFFFGEAKWNRLCRSIIKE